MSTNSCGMYLTPFSILISKECWFLIFSYPIYLTISIVASNFIFVLFHLTFFLPPPSPPCAHCWICLSTLMKSIMQLWRWIVQKKEWKKKCQFRVKWSGDWRWIPFVVYLYKYFRFFANNQHTPAQLDPAYRIHWVWFGVLLWRTKKKKKIVWNKKLPKKYKSNQCINIFRCLLFSINIKHFNNLF